MPLADSEAPSGVSGGNSGARRLGFAAMNLDLNWAKPERGCPAGTAESSPQHVLTCLFAATIFPETDDWVRTNSEIVV